MLEASVDFILRQTVRIPEIRKGRLSSFSTALPAKAIRQCRGPAMPDSH